MPLGSLIFLSTLFLTDISSLLQISFLKTLQITSGILEVID